MEFMLLGQTKDQVLIMIYLHKVSALMAVQIGLRMDLKYVVQVGTKVQLTLLARRVLGAWFWHGKTVEVDCLIYMHKKYLLKVTCNGQQTEFQFHSLLLHK